MYSRNKDNVLKFISFMCYQMPLRLGFADENRWVGVIETLGVSDTQREFIRYIDAERNTISEEEKFSKFLEEVLEYAAKKEGQRIIASHCT